LGLGVGVCGPKPKSPIPNPQSPIPNDNEKNLKYYFIIKKLSQYINQN